jgi:large subunit ribosomal protein L9
MEVILKENIKNLGYKNDVVKVKPGYGRNYLLPQGLAVMATKGNLRMMEENLKQVAHKAEKIRNAALDLANGIGDLVLTIKAKVGESGKIFGKVTALQISDALKEKGFEVDRKKITFEEEIKTIGTYHAVLNLHKEVIHRVKFEVVSE